MKLPENTDINKHVIEQVEGKQLFYGLIYTLSPVESEILEAYIKTYLETRFIRLFKSPTNIFIFFDKKPNSNIHLYIID